MNLTDALSTAKAEAEQIPEERRQKLSAAFDTAAREAQAHSDFRRS